MKLNVGLPSWQSHHYFRTFKLRSFFSVLWVVAMVSGCGGGGSGSTAPVSTASVSGPPISTSWTGVVAVDDQQRSGAITLRSLVTTTIVNGKTLESPTGTVTGAIATTGGSTVSLTGTLTQATKSVTVQGGGYQFTATYAADGTLSGSGAYTAGLAAQADQRVTAMAASSSKVAVSAQVLKSGQLVQSYFGRYDGIYTSPRGNETEGGGFCFTLTGFSLYGTAPASCSPGQECIPDYFTFTGSVNGGNVSASVIGANQTMTGSGTLSGGYSGSYSGSDGIGRSSGTWQVRPTGPAPTLPPDPSPPASPPAPSLGN